MQAERRNPSAAAGYLRVAGEPSGWGLYPNKIRWYDQFGFPVIGPGGVYWDQTYAPDEPLPFAIPILVNNEQLYTLLTYVRQAVAGGVLEATAAAHGYIRNADLLVSAVMTDWDFVQALSDEVVAMLPILLASIAAEVTSRLFILTGRAELMAVGHAIHVAAITAGWVLEAKFYGELALLAVRAGGELLLVRRTPDGTLDALSRRHLDAAAQLVRKIVTQMVMILAVKQGPEAVRTVWGTGRASARAMSELMAVCPELGLAWAGAYGEGPGFDAMVMQGGDAPVPRRSRGRRRADEPPPDRPQKDFEKHEDTVIEYVRANQRENSATFYTCRGKNKRQVRMSTIYQDFRAFADKIRETGLVDPWAEANPRVLEWTREQVIAGTDLADLCARRNRELLEEVRHAEREVAAAKDVRDSQALKDAEQRRDKRVLEWEKWNSFMQVKVKNQEVDACAFDPTTRQVEVIDPSLAWADPMHNLKSRIYLESFNRLLGWEGGSWFDVGSGLFRNRMWVAPPSTSAYY